MIKIEDLRIGNRVNFGEVFSIDNTDGQGTVYCIDNFGGQGSFLIKDIEGIDITEKSLLGLRFKEQSTAPHFRKLTLDINSKQQFAWYSIDGVLRFQSIGSGYTMDWGIKYIHQIQNAYKVITGKDLICFG